MESIRTGDKGQTTTLSGAVLSKTDPLIHFQGAADELNCRLGMVKALFATPAMLSGEDTSITHHHRFLEDIQKNIMKLMSHAADISNDDYHFHEDEIAALEKEIERLSEKLPQLNHFVIPGANILEAQIHLARTAARNAERLFFAVSEKRPLCPQAGAYLNRLSDYLFVLSQVFSLFPAS